MSTSPRQHSSLKLSRLVGFAITTKPEEAKRFYGEKLGFRFLKDDGFALVFDANGSLLRVSKMQKFTPAQHTVLGWAVDDIEDVVHELNARGVVFERYPS